MKRHLALFAVVAFVFSNVTAAAGDRQYLFDLAEHVVLASVVDVGEVQVADKTFVGATLAVEGVVKGDYPLAIAIALLPGPGISYREGAQELSVGDRGLFMLGRSHSFKDKPIAMAMLRFVSDSDMADRANKHRFLAMAVASKIKSELQRLRPMSKTESQAMRVPGSGSCVVQLGFNKGLLELADIKTSSGDLRFDEQLLQAAYSTLSGVNTLLDGLVELTFENGVQ